MIRTLNELGDRLLEKVLPTTTAAAGWCWEDTCCSGKYCRDCCLQDNGVTTCGDWFYC